MYGNANTGPIYGMNTALAKRGMNAVPGENSGHACNCNDLWAYFCREPFERCGDQGLIV